MSFSHSFFVSPKGSVYTQATEEGEKEEDEEEGGAFAKKEELFFPLQVVHLVPPPRRRRPFFPRLLHVHALSTRNTLQRSSSVFSIFFCRVIRRASERINLISFRRIIEKQMRPDRVVFLSPSADRKEIGTYFGRFDFRIWIYVRKGEKGGKGDCCSCVHDHSIFSSSLSLFC